MPGALYAEQGRIRCLLGAPHTTGPKIQEEEEEEEEEEEGAPLPHK
jgi:hypothetical protein